MRRTLNKRYLSAMPGWVSSVIPRHLEVRHIPSALHFQLTRPFEVRSLTVGYLVVPSGYVTDGASVPRFFWSLFPPFGRYVEAAVVHDWIYSDACHKYTRLQADWVFLELLKVLQIPAWKRWVMFGAVRVFGRGNW